MSRKIIELGRAASAALAVVNRAEKTALENEGRKSFSIKTDFLKKPLDQEAQESLRGFLQNFLESYAPDSKASDFAAANSEGEDFAREEFLKLTQEFMQDLLKHAAQDSAMLDDFCDKSAVLEGVQVDQKMVTNAANYVFQITAASQVFFSASILSAMLSEKGFEGLEAIKKNPRMLVDGGSMMVLYNIFATEAALMVGSKVRGEVGNESLMRAVASILSSSVTETLIGNSLDFYSLKDVFLSAKIEHALKANPALFDDLRADKDLFRKLIPENLRQFSNEELAKNFSKLHFSTENIKKIPKPEFNISTKEWLKMSAAGATFASLRNINFYLVTYLINQSNAAAKDGEKKDLTPLEIGAIGAVGAFITSPLNMAAYSSAFRVNEGLDISQSMKQALKHAFADTAKNPRIFACLVAVRAAATLICSAIFSDKTKEIISEAVDGLAKAISSVAKSEEENVLEKPQGLEVKGKKSPDIKTLFDAIELECARLQKSASAIEQGDLRQSPSTSNCPIKSEAMTEAALNRKK